MLRGGGYSCHSNTCCHFQFKTSDPTGFQEEEEKEDPGNAYSSLKFLSREPCYLSKGLELLVPNSCIIFFLSIRFLIYTRAESVALIVLLPIPHPHPARPQDNSNGTMHSPPTQFCISPTSKTRLPLKDQLNNHLSSGAACWGDRYMCWLQPQKFPT